MDERDRLSVQFEASRSRLRALALRMLGSPEEAEDAVQETWLRVDRADAGVVGIVGRSPDAARQLASRARRRIQGALASSAVDFVRRRELVEAFLAAARDGNFDALLTILDPNVALVPDAAATRMGALREAHGVEAVLSFMGGGGARAARLALVGGAAGLAWMPGGRMRGAVEFAIDDDRIVQINVIGDPDHIEDLDVVVLED